MSAIEAIRQDSNRTSDKYAASKSGTAFRNGNETCEDPTVVVLPISSAKKSHIPTHIRIYGSKMLPKNSIVLAEQIRTIDRNRLQNYVGSVGLEVMEKVDKAVKISIGVGVDD